MKGVGEGGGVLARPPVLRSPGSERGPPPAGSNKHTHTLLETFGRISLYVTDDAILQRSM